MARSRAGRWPRLAAAVAHAPPGVCCDPPSTVRASDLGGRALLRTERGRTDRRVVPRPPQPCRLIDATRVQHPACSRRDIERQGWWAGQTADNAELVMS